MKKKNILILTISSCVAFAIFLFLILFFNIPRLHYSYDASTDSYFVDRVYGNASSYVIPDSKDSKPITTIRSRVFMNHSSLKEVKLGKNIKVIERMAFLDCKKLEVINLEFVESIGRNAFENCIALKKVDLGIYDVMGGCFLGCTTLEEVSLRNTQTIGSYAFACTGIISISIPSTCNDVGEYAFYQCEKLQKIVVKSSALSQNAYLKSLDVVEFQG